MESLAALVATILFGFIAIALVNLVLVVLVRRGKLKLWVGILSNSITCFAAIIGITGSWLLGLAPLISTLAGSLIILIPRIPFKQQPLFANKSHSITRKAIQSSSENGTPPSVEIIDVELGYVDSGIFEPAVGPISLVAEPGQAVAIVGPSGCGKSTLLMAVLGQIKPKSGSVIVKSDNFVDVHTAVVFQENTVFPWLTALENVAYPLKLQGKSHSETRTLAFDWLTRVGLQKSANKYPHELSGGMVQRVALARALASKPNLLILDEPFGQVDELTRLDLGVLLSQLLKESNITSLLVTHSIDEALLICNKVIALSKSPGKLVLDLDFDLPAPRTKKSLSQPRFLETRRKILDSLSPLDMTKFGQQ